MPRVLDQDLTLVQAQAIHRMGRGDAYEIVRFAGGYWAPPGTETHQSGGLDFVPVWWTTADTLRALARRGLVEWRDRHTYRLTESGRAIARELASMLCPSTMDPQGDPPPARGSDHGGPATEESAGPCAGSSPLPEEGA